MAQSYHFSDGKKGAGLYSSISFFDDIHNVVEIRNIIQIDLVDKLLTF